MASSQQRSWCPALPAMPESLEATVSPKRTQRYVQQDAASPIAAIAPDRVNTVDGPSSPARGKGGSAADLSVSASSSSVDIVHRVHKSQTFSSRVANSHVALGRIDRSNPKPAALRDLPRAPLTATLPSLQCVRSGAAYVDCRSCTAAADALKQCAKLRADADAEEDRTGALTKGSIAIRMHHAQRVPTQDFDRLVADSDEFQAHCVGLDVTGSLRGSNAAHVLATRLIAAPPPPKEEEPQDEEAAEEEDEDEAAAAARREAEAQRKGKTPPPPIRPPPQLVSLILQSNGPALGGGPGNEEGNPAAIEELGKYIAGTKTLKALNLGDCGLGANNGIVSLVPSLLANGSLEALDLSGNAIGKSEEGAEKLAELLQQDKFLLHCSVEDNDLTGAQCKALAQALAQSETRMPTPEPPAEPEWEAYQDELPPEEDPPAQPIGFPEDLERKAREEEEAARRQAEAEERAARGEEGDEEGDGRPPAEGDEKEADGEADEEAAAAEEEKKATPPPEAKAEGEGEEEEEEEEDGGKKKGADDADDKKGDAPVEEEEELDEEERAAREEERLEKERIEFEEKKAAHDERHEQYIWGPERAHFEFDESKVRRDIMQCHIDETTALKLEEKASRDGAKKEQLARERRDRERRSGWTHLRSLSLAANPIGSEGAAAVAEMLRHQIPLEAVPAEEGEEGDDHNEADEAEDEGADNEVEEEDLGPGPDIDEADMPPASDDGQPVDDDDNDNGGDDGDEGAAPEAGEEENKTDDAEQRPKAKKGSEKKPKAPKPPPPTHKRGVQTIEYLDLTSCGIGPKGLTALSATIASNCPVLTTLLLRRNKFALKHKDLPHPEATEEDDPPKPSIRVTVEDFLSPGIVAFADCLKTNTTLTTLDLSFNGMFPVAINALAAGLKANRTITALYLDGNNIGIRSNEDPAADESGFPALTDALGNMTQLTVLTLANTHLGQWLNSGPNDDPDKAKKKGPTDPVYRNKTALFGRLENLRVLDVSFNDLGNNGALAICSAFPPQSRLLRALYLDACGLSGEEGGRIVAGLLEKCRGVQVLSLSENAALGATGVSQLLPGLKGATAITTLNLRRTGLEGLPTGLLPTVEGLSMLQDIDLGDMTSVSAAEAVEATKTFVNCAAVRAFSLWSRTGSDAVADKILVTLAETIKHPEANALEFVNCAVQAPEGVPLEDTADEGTNGCSVSQYTIEEVEQILQRRRVVAAVRR